MIQTRFWSSKAPFLKEKRKKKNIYPRESINKISSESLQKYIQVMKMFDHFLSFSPKNIFYHLKTLTVPTLRNNAEILSIYWTNRGFLYKSHTSPNHGVWNPWRIFPWSFEGKSCDVNPRFPFNVSQNYKFFLRFFLTIGLLISKLSEEKST